MVLGGGGRRNGFGGVQEGADAASLSTNLKSRWAKYRENLFLLKLANKKEDEREGRKRKVTRKTFFSSSVFWPTAEVVRRSSFSCVCCRWGPKYYVCVWYGGLLLLCMSGLVVGAGPDIK